ncbi:MAG: SRPBCC family protein [Flavobacteriaceae bacterium]
MEMINPSNGRELVLERLLDAPRGALWRCWTEPELLKQWFCPKPWTVSHAEMDVRPGGSSMVVMRSPEGEEFPNPGIFLEVVPQKKLVMTDAYTSAWQPSQKPFMTTVITFEDEGDKTRYVARCFHWSEEDRVQHEAMGFHDGWGQAASQLEELARTV